MARTVRHGAGHGEGYESLFGSPMSMSGQADMPGLEFDNSAEIEAAENVDR